MRDYEQIIFDIGSAPIYWREHEGDDLIELTAMCNYIAEKLFLDRLYLMWPAGKNERKYFKTKVPKHFDPPYIKEVVIPGAQKLIDAFDVKFVNRYIRFNRRGV